MGKPSDRGGRAKGVGELVPAAGAKAFAKHGFAQGALVARWAEIVGPELARHSSPRGLARARPGGLGGALTIGVSSAYAPRLAMIAPEVIAAVNRFLGRAHVARLTLVHADAPAPPAPPPPEPPPPPPLDRATAGSLRAIADPALRAALEALARRLDARTEPPARVEIL